MNCIFTLVTLCIILARLGGCDVYRDWSPDGLALPIESLKQVLLVPLAGPCWVVAAPTHPGSEVPRTTLLVSGAVAKRLGMQMPAAPWRDGAQ